MWVHCILPLDCVILPSGHQEMPGERNDSLISKWKPKQTKDSYQQRDSPRDCVDMLCFTPSLPVRPCCRSEPASGCVHTKPPLDYVGVGLM